jgi:RNA polymerase sigma-70 factor, ECF subfamily
VTITAVTESEFVRTTEPYRRELLVHCYRMLGSVDDAEDVVQDTYIRAWRSYSGFEGRSSVRTWLYTIATNATLSALAHHSRRVLPSGLGAPTDDPGADALPAAPGIRWLEPIPDALIAPESDDPAAIVAARAGLRLALIASLQRLPPRQRAVLILRDVLSFRAHEVAAMLGTSTEAVKSALQRARAGLEHVGSDELTEPGEPRARALLERYMAAFERSDMSLLERALRADAALEMAGSTTWFAGKQTCVPYIRRFLRTPGGWRMVPSIANGQPAALAYQRGDDGAHVPFAVAVLTVSSAGIGRITLFSDSRVLARFGAQAASRP